MRQIHLNAGLFIIIGFLASTPTSHAQGCAPACDDRGLGCCDRLPWCDGSSGCECDACAMKCCEPLWRVTADALFLHRDDPSDGVIAFNTANPAQQLRGQDFNFDTHTGFDLSLTRRLGTCNAVELRYFGIDQWNATAAAATTPNELLRFNAAVPIFAQSGDAISASLVSKLHNSEINLKHQVCDWLGLLAGFRCLELNERANASLVNAAVPVNYSAKTTNRLYGAQLGAEAALLHHKRINVDFIGKAGIYGNHSAHNAFVSTGAATVTAIGNGSPTSFIGELGVVSSMRLTDHLSLRSGYRLLWLDGVAEVSDQLASSDFFAGTGFDGSGNVFYHGAIVGLELAY